MKVKVSEAKVWEVTNEASAPVMFCAYVPGNSLSIETEQACVRALLKVAAKQRVQFTAITNAVHDDGLVVTLVGTRDDS